MEETKLVLGNRVLYVGLLLPPSDGARVALHSPFHAVNNKKAFNSHIGVCLKE